MDTIELVGIREQCLRCGSHAISLCEICGSLCCLLCDMPLDIKLCACGHPAERHGAVHNADHNLAAEIA